MSNELRNTDIAVVGMAGRFPGARDIDQFWRNLRDGVESIVPLDEETLRAAGVPDELLKHPRYVRAAAVLDDMDMVDAGFFGLSPKDASIMDPQHRHFLECCWEAFEHSGYNPESYPGAVGVFGGCGMNSYFMFNLLTNPQLVHSVGLFLLRHTGNDKDFLATRVSYTYNLKGPSVSIQTACSTSLVAIHTACQSLLNGECDMALAGGVTIEIPHGRGYLYEEGEILSVDGHCRSFDAESTGTVFGSGVGVVVLKRAEDAVRDGDTIHAIIRGSAINNDGSSKVGYLAPSVDGQAAAVAEALTLAGVEPDTVTYVATHGTATRVGDPIEVAALNQAFGIETDKPFCALTSVKSNIGHLDTAAGVASFIAAVQAIKHAQIPPSLHFKTPNPLIDFNRSPFFVNHQLREWNTGDMPRRAGVSSLGVGGTNAHIILQQAPAQAESLPGRSLNLFPLSARSEAVLNTLTDRFACHLSSLKQSQFSDAAYTAQVGRKAFRHRRCIVAADSTDFHSAWNTREANRVISDVAETSQPSVVFLFAGGGAQHPGMGAALYRAEPVYRAAVDSCLAALRQYCNHDIRSVLFPSEADGKTAAAAMERPSIGLPALFITEYALARLWMSWGIKPDAMVAHSAGAYAQACIAGVMTPEEALWVVYERGRLFETLPEGAMLSVPLSEQELSPLLGSDLSIAAVNSPGLCVASGNVKAINALEQTLKSQEVECQRIKIQVAAHSEMVAGILDDFRRAFAKVRLQPPWIPFVSDLTGTWITANEAQDPDYWVMHLRSTVRFSEAISCVLAEPNRIFLEAGPGRTLTSLTRQQPGISSGHRMITSLAHPREPISDLQTMLLAVGKMWARGKTIDWNLIDARPVRRRVPLPTYPFQHERHWIEPGKLVAEERPDNSAEGELVRRDFEDWFSTPVWNPEPLKTETELDASKRWLIFTDAFGIGTAAAKLLSAAGCRVAIVSQAEAYSSPEPDRYCLAPGEKDHFEQLFLDLTSREQIPDRILYLWTLTDDSRIAALDSLQPQLDLSFFTPLFLLQTLASEASGRRIRLAIATNRLHRVKDEPCVRIERAAAIGPCRVTPHELPELSPVNVDLALAPEQLGQLTHDHTRQAAATLIQEINADSRERLVAYRDARYVQRAEALRLSPGKASPKLRPNGVYLITGGLGALGLLHAKYLAQTAQARLVLCGRFGLPDRTDWENWISTYGEQDAITQKIRTVLELEAAGAQVVIAQGDINNPNRVRDIVLQCGRDLGPINGVIHAAGVLDDGPLQLKDRYISGRVLSSKIQGTLVLAEALRDEKLDFFVLFSSTSSLLGPPGQIDYTSANAFLNAFAGSGLFPNTSAIQWGVWKEVGMAAALRNKLAARASALSEEEQNGHAILGELVEQSDQEIIYAAAHEASSHWVFSGHRVQGSAILPGTGHIELAVAAALTPDRGRLVRIRNLSFIEPLVVPEDEKACIRVSLSRSGDTFDFSVMSAQGDEWIEHSSAEVEIRPSDPNPHTTSLDALTSRCNLQRFDLPQGSVFTHQDRLVEFGPEWRSLRKAWVGAEEAVALLRLPENAAGQASHYFSHPALLDIATGFGLRLLSGYDQSADLYVPVRYGEITFFGVLPAEIYSHIRVRNPDRSEPSFDVDIYDSESVVKLSVRDFRVKRMATSSLAQNAVAPVDAGSDEMAGAPTMLDRWMEHGISPAEGVEAFSRVLSGGAPPEVTVSSIDVARLAADLQRAAEPPADGPKPEVKPRSAEDAPRDEVEQYLADLWASHLGCSTISIHDDFFDLGGHSLVALRIFTAIKKTYKVQLGLATVFDARTIAKLADVLRKQMPSAAPAADRPSADKAAPEPSATPGKWSAVVPIQPGDGKRPPFFLVHGAGGNVVGFSTLVRHLESELPVYALQSPGVDGVEEILTTVEAMAERYISDIREVQPHGPYYLAGYSFGGVVAFEMAQQFKAAGERVAFVGMFDTYQQYYLKEHPEKAAVQVQKQSPVGEKSNKHLKHLLVGPNRLQYISIKVRDYYRNILVDRFYKWYVRSGAKLPKKLEVLQYVNPMAGENYAPRYYDGKITLFRARMRESHDPYGYYLGWEGKAKQIEVHEVPGWHSNMAEEPNVSFLAAKITWCLHRATTAVRVLSAVRRRVAAMRA